MPYRVELMKAEIPVAKGECNGVVRWTWNSCVGRIMSDENNDSKKTIAGNSPPIEE